MQDKKNPLNLRIHFHRSSIKSYKRNDHGIKNNNSFNAEFSYFEYYDFNHINIEILDIILNSAERHFYENNGLNQLLYNKTQFNGNIQNIEYIVC